jgi:hypothetical protein
VTCEAEWNGAHLQRRKQFLRTKKIETFVESHFGSGILTFNVGVIITTCPGYDLWVSGPANEFKDGIQASSAVIETYWMPVVFSCSIGLRSVNTQEDRAVGR